MFAGDADWEANINTQLQGGNPPNISFFPQPGKLADFVEQGFVVPVSDNVVAAVEESWAPTSPRSARSTACSTACRRSPT